MKKRIKNFQRKFSAFLSRNKHHFDHLLSVFRKIASSTSLSSWAALAGLAAFALAAYQYKSEEKFRRISVILNAWQAVDLARERYKENDFQNFGHLDAIKFLIDEQLVTENVLQNLAFDFIDFSKQDLRGFNLNNVRFYGSNFKETQFNVRSNSHVDMHYADLSNANITVYLPSNLVLAFTYLEGTQFIIRAPYSYGKNVKSKEEQFEEIVTSLQNLEVEMSLSCGNFSITGDETVIKAAKELQKQEQKTDSLFRNRHTIPDSVDYKVLLQVGDTGIIEVPVLEQKSLKKERLKSDDCNPISIYQLLQLNH